MSSTLFFCVQIRSVMLSILLLLYYVDIDMVVLDLFCQYYFIYLILYVFTIFGMHTFLASFDIGRPIPFYFLLFCTIKLIYIFCESTLC